MNKINELVCKFESLGKTCFTHDDLKKLNLSPNELKMSIYRLRKNRKIETAVSGFYVIIGAQDLSMGSPRPEDFISQLACFWKSQYYIGLLSAAKWHGSSHQVSQVFQVVLQKQKRNLKIGKYCFDFVTKSTFPKENWIEKRNSKTSQLNISSPELTAFDLIYYINQAGGINNVATVLRELFEVISHKKFSKTVDLPFPISVFQRLGYLLDLLNLESFSTLIYSKVKNEATNYVRLVPSSQDDATRNEKWKLYINYKVEPDL